MTLDTLDSADLFTWLEGEGSPQAYGPAALQVHGDDGDFLRRKEALPSSGEAGRVTLVDLFSGCGGLSLGVTEAAKAAGLSFDVLGAVDTMQAALDVYAANFKGASTICGDVAALLPKDASEGLTDFEKGVLSRANGRLGIVVGGPPCQGHSDLNNFTRRDDPKNELYLHMGRAGVALRPDALLIENVAGSPHDKAGVVGRTLSMLQGAGYHVDARLVDLSMLGVAQNRKRYLILATRTPAPSLESLLRPYVMGTRNLEWAIGDLASTTGPELDRQIAKPSKDNARRIDYLFDHDLRDLPNSERPPCHRDKAHAYNSVYGRLSWDKPAPTITGGFHSICMGRYVHPDQRRTLVAREAARIQFFPDHFDFSPAKTRTALAKIIGNAVPMKLTYAVTAELIRLGIVRSGNSHA